jgi:hypothetical protein
MTNKKISNDNKKISEKVAAQIQERNDKLDRFGRLLATAARSSQYTDLAGDSDMLLLMQSAVAFTNVSDKLYSKGDMNSETKMGMCFLMGYVIGRNTVQGQGDESSPKDNNGQ